MSISPINFNGMLQNNSEVGNVKIQEDSRGTLAQNVAQTAQTQTEQQVAQSVQQTENNDPNAFDMNGGGYGYGGDGGQNRRKNDGKEKKALADGSVTIKNQHKGFNITI